MNNNSDDTLDFTKHETKAVNFLKSTKLLFSKEHFNCAANRLYYTFYQLALRNMLKYNVDSSFFYMDNQGEKIDKTKIAQNPKKLEIKMYREFRYGMVDAKAARVKADYTIEDVLPEDIEEIIKQIERIITREGINVL